MEYSVQLQKLCQIEARRCVLVVGMVGLTYLMLQYFMLPYGNALKSLLPDNEILLSVKSSSLSSQLLVKSANEGEIHASDVGGVVKQDGESDGDVNIESDNEVMEIDRNVQEIAESKVEGQKDENDTTAAHNMDPVSSDVNDRSNENEFSALEVGGFRKNSSMSETENVEQIVGVERQSSPDSSLDSNWNQAGLVLPKDVEEFESTKVGRHRRKKARLGEPPISVVSMERMNHRLARHLASSRRRKPQWSSLREPDKEILDAKLKIIDAAVSNVDEKLYPPVFRNVSSFVRSYELMEQTLKVYVYRDGKKPIFHQPILKGLYASEGWFMKLMEGNKHFLVKKPEKAHLFYMPFSSRMLEYALYVPGSHNRTQLRQFVKNYTETIAAKYPFWNRTGGRDHFIVACHDWAPYETRHHMENSIKALCNADVTIGFKIGRDVSLPETFVRYARNPLRDVGGKPPSKRTILAFYAGNSHGYLRPNLLKHWKDKDPAMRIYGLLPLRVSRKMNYIQHMKSSKYCICPKGFEVNSPRIVEAIFYECVPVIISDNFVPPFFEVLNWEAFSVILTEKDIPNLKDILLAIPDEKYAEMQLAVRKVQQHFLWHARPVKYDLFHMTLHSIWYSRVFQI